jgi:hypothetical protein
MGIILRLAVVEVEVVTLVVEVQVDYRPICRLSHVRLEQHSLIVERSR